MKPGYLDQFVQAYIACALWSTGDDECESLGDFYGPSDLSQTALSQAREECEDFIRHTDIDKCSHWDAEQAGHDFWLTRCGHGSGFWDRFGRSQPGYLNGKRFTEAAKLAGSRSLYVGDNGLLYFSEG